MKKILVSACLIGDQCRYDGKGKRDERIIDLLDEFEIIPFCPEVEGGLPTPRPPAELRGGKAVREDGEDVTRFFKAGAEKAYLLCHHLQIEAAILKENSPSCATHRIHDGYFDNHLKDGMGITASYLTARGIRCYSEDQIEEFLRIERPTLPHLESPRKQAPKREEKPRGKGKGTYPRKKGYSKGKPYKGDKRKQVKEPR